MAASLFFQEELFNKLYLKQASSVFLPSRGPGMSEPTNVPTNVKFTITV